MYSLLDYHTLTVWSDHTVKIRLSYTVYWGDHTVIPGSHNQYWTDRFTHSNGQLMSGYTTRKLPSTLPTPQYRVNIWSLPVHVCKYREGLKLLHKTVRIFCPEPGAIMAAARWTLQHKLKLTIPFSRTLWCPLHSEQSIVLNVKYTRDTKLP